jgi:GNAT superfamily N-acetyltransferase
MIIHSKNNKQVLLKRLNPVDFDKLLEYLHALGPDTLRRFGPHPFEKQSIIDLFENSGNHHGYIAINTESSEIIAYSIVKIGYLEHDSFRLQSYGLTLDNDTDCTYAPSVADCWQSLGVGNSLFSFILNDLKKNGIKRIILWGGVQCDNNKAVNFYLKNDFRIPGKFEYNGENYDMIKEIG